MIFLQQGLVNARSVVESLRVGEGGKFHQVLVTGKILGEEDQVVPGARVPFGMGFRSDIRFATENRLHTLLEAGVIEMFDAEKIAVVGNRTGGHSKSLGSGHKLIGLADAVKE